MRIREPLPNLEIDDMHKSDLEAVMKVERQSFSLPWGESTFRHGISRKNPHAHWLVVRYQQLTIAFINFWLVDDAAHITNFAVSPEYRRKGVGKYLLAKSLEYIRHRGGRAVSLEVRASNIPAQNLYRQMGFHPAFIRREYYRDNGEDAYVFRIDDLSKVELEIDQM
jgi:ribosomal-protein-alanine N-acetyltransferase